jgi:hypothetical protein
VIIEVIDEKPEMEVVSIEDQALQAVQQAPTEFTVPFSEQKASRLRIKAFFDTYGSGSRLVSSESGAAIEGTTAHYRYRISEQDSAQGVHYKVHCAALSTAMTGCQLNAPNVARFIHQGILEVSLLKK